MPLDTTPATHTHPTYRDGGVRLPSVTTILAALDNPGLDRWRVNQALMGIDPYKDRRAADTGSLCHAAIAAALTGEPWPDVKGYADDVVAQAVAAQRAWRAWQAAHEVEPILVEHQMASKALGYAGTLDFFGRVDGRLELIDWKTSADIYPEYFVQGCAYARLLAETTGHVAEAVRIVRLNKDIQYTTDEVWIPKPDREPLFEERHIEGDGAQGISEQHMAVFEAARLVHGQRLAWNRKGGDTSKAA